MPANVAPPELLLQLAQNMIMNGWQPVWCLARQSGAYTPVPGTTGGSSPFPTVVAQPAGAHRLAFRPPPGVVAFDVDHYDHKRGMDTMDKAEAWLGDLPATFRVTSRGYGNPSGRYLFRKPDWLDFTDSALAQFADEHGGTHIEIVRTAHRFSWAPGDVNHKNGQLVQCFDPLGEVCLLPNVDELPELPERWVNYLANPPVPQSATAYTRPADGPEWWLAQADNSLGHRTELAEFALYLLASRLNPGQAMEQLKRVALALNPAEPWEEHHLSGLVDANTEQKAAALVQAQEKTVEHLPASQGELNEIAERTSQAFETERKLRALREQRILETVQQQALFEVRPLTQDNPQPSSQSPADYLAALVRGTPEYDRQFKLGLARLQADRDVAFVLARKFSGFRDISRLEEPPAPTMLTIVGRDSNPQPIIAPGSITVISGHRSAGKTWAAAKWAEQQILEGSHVIWIDFERQDRGLNAKLKYMGLQPHAIAYHLHYSDELPALTDLTDALAELGPCLLVIDAFRGLQARLAPGTSANDGDAIEQYIFQEFLNLYTKAGGTAVVLDHLPKSGTTTFGAERKESAADYVIRVEQAQPFTKSDPGYSTLTVTKDRWGNVGQNTVAGFLWMPGDGRNSADAGITKYPKTPMFRNWAPEPDNALEDVAASTGKAQGKLRLVRLVSEEPVNFYSQNSLAKAAMADTSGPFRDVKLSTVKNWIRELTDDGTFTASGQGSYRKLSMAPPVLEGTIVHQPRIRPGDLRHESERETE
jgi:hypothetical protein